MKTFVLSACLLCGCTAEQWQTVQQRYHEGAERGRIAGRQIGEGLGNDLGRFFTAYGQALERQQYYRSLQYRPSFHTGTVWVNGQPVFVSGTW